MAVAKISINGNLEMDAFPDKTGSGTEIDPYVMSDIIIGSSGMGAAINITNVSRFVRLERITTTRTYMYDPHFPGIFLSKCSNFVASECVCDENTYGIYFEKCSNCFIDECTVQNSLRYGILFDECMNCMIDESLIEHNDGGIQITNLVNNIVIHKSSIVYNSEDGLSIYDGNNIQIEDNLFSNNGMQSIYGYNCSELTMKLNHINSGSHTGIRLRYCTNAVLSDNTIESSETYSIGMSLTATNNSLINHTEINVNYIGISLSRCNNDQFLENSISNTQNGISMYYCSDLYLSHNKFHNVGTKIENIGCSNIEIIKYINWNRIIIWISFGISIIILVFVSIIIHKKRKPIRTARLEHEKLLIDQKYRCSQCGNIMQSDDDGYCVYCGKILIPEEFTNLKEKQGKSSVSREKTFVELKKRIRCENCGRSLKDIGNLEYCVFCGFRFPS
jgi:parallel beta-helix repeat protein